MIILPGGSRIISHTSLVSTTCKTYELSQEHQHMVWIIIDIPYPVYKDTWVSSEKQKQKSVTGSGKLGFFHWLYCLNWHTLVEAKYQWLLQTFQFDHCFFFRNVNQCLDTTSGNYLIRLIMSHVYENINMYLPPLPFVWFSSIWYTFNECFQLCQRKEQCLRPSSRSKSALET